jgi:predicted Zn-dependent protease
MGFGRFGAIAAALLLAGFSPAQAERSAASAALGAENHPQILARFGGEVPDSTLRDYVARVAGNIVAVSAQPDEDWLFTVLDSAQVNAFALPGGYVYVTRGLLALAGDEAELAAVLAHEIVHVTQEHVEARVDAQAEDQTGEVVGNLLGNLLGGVISGSENPLGDALRNTIQDSMAGGWNLAARRNLRLMCRAFPY